MKKIRFNKKYLAGILVAAICAAGVKTPLFAAPAIQTDKKSSLTIQVEDTTIYGEDIQKAQIQVKIYKIADVLKTGAFVSTEDFKDLKIEEIAAGQEDWAKTAAEAEQIVEERQPKETGELTVEQGTGSVKDLENGLYLVAAQDTSTDLYTYRFSPYIISLPDNLYSQTKDTKDDAWIYDVTAGLKPERQDRYGSVKIVKTVKEFNASLGQATFVFSVEGVDAEGNVVYSNVASTTFDQAGTKEAVLDGIPAGTKLTVTEVYSGASYTLISEPSKTGTIVADETM